MSVVIRWPASVAAGRSSAAWETGEDAARAEKEEPFECRVIDRVKERGGERDRREDAAHALRAPQNHRQPHADQNDPDVLDAVEREQAFEVVLLERVEHAEHRRRRARDKHRPTP